jgi:hypothetical protein
MARKLRVAYPGDIYHVLNRVAQREPIFQDDQDRLVEPLVFAGKPWVFPGLGGGCLKIEIRPLGLPE